MQGTAKWAHQVSIFSLQRDSCVALVIYSLILPADVNWSIPHCWCEFEHGGLDM
jgi:hypothetical protein